MIDKKTFANQARTWIGTKFHHQGRLKKTCGSCGGCDCIGLLIGVIKELSMEKTIGCNSIDCIDKKDYRRIVTTSALEDNIKQYFQEKNKCFLEVGDIVLFCLKDSKYPHHIGVINEICGELTLIHAFLDAGYVVEHILDEYWISSIHSVYSFDCI